METEVYTVKLDDIFEGPMDLLVHLIKKHEVDIYNIPIALITDQYLEYLELMKLMNIDVAGEFLVLAATLTQIKSKMLIPVHEDEDDQEDPLLEITRPLAEYLQMKSAARQLADRHLLGEDTFVRHPEQEALALMRRQGYDYAEVPTRFRERIAGQSSISGWGTAYYAVKVFLALLVDRARPVDPQLARAKLIGEI